MRLALLIYGSLDTLSGGYLYDRILVNYLRKQGHSVEIISLPWRNYAQHLTDNFSLHFARQLQKLEVDVLIEDELNHPSLAWRNGWLRKQVGYPIVSLVHHLRSDEEHPPLLRPLYRWVERSYLNSVDAFIYNSATTRRAVEQLSPQPRRSLIAYPAATHLPIPTLARLHELLQKKQQQPEPLRLLFIGTLTPRKGLHTLLDGLALVRDNRWQLAVVGGWQADSAYVEKIRRQIARLQLQAQVTLHGTLPQAQLVALLEESHLLAVPSFEGFGIVYLEAMAYGLPVIACTAGAAHEVVSEGNNGFLVPPGSSQAIAQQINFLCANRSWLHEASHQARQRFDQHPTWEESCESILQFLHEVLPL